LKSRSGIKESLLFGDGFVDCGDGVGVSVAPVYWPTDVAPFLSATGAGDFTSAVVAAYVW
jgi:hypothetical protein